MLNTERLVLKWATISDAPLLLELNKDPEVVRYTGDTSLKDLNEAKDQILHRLEPQRINYKMGRFMVFLKDGTFIGWCGLRYFPESHEVDLGYRLMKKFWGKGFATEASKISLQYGFETLNLKKIIARAHPQNVASIKVMQKLGMTFRGVLKEESDLEPWVVYEILERDLKK